MSISNTTVYQLAQALENKGKFTPEDFTKLTQFSNLPGIKDILDGKAEISYSEHLIDCDAAPFTPDGWKVEEHKAGGMHKYSQTSISLYLSDKQKKGSIDGHKLRKLLADKSVLNANVLDYLLAHPELIPEDWKSKYVFFWGTIFRYSNGNLYVRYLNWIGSQWHWDYYWLGNDFDSGDPAAVAS